jgi:hypothetical protein
MLAKNLLILKAPQMRTGDEKDNKEEDFTDLMRRLGV